MIQQITELFKQEGSKKIVFIPQIRVAVPQKQTTWIDDIYQVKDVVFVTVSNHDDNYKIRLDMLNDDEQKALLKVMQEIGSILKYHPA